MQSVAYLQTHHKRRQIAAMLHDVPDPEIPGVSIVELGMIIDICQKNNAWEVILAATYTGCPAIDVIPYLVKTRLHEEGMDDVNVRMHISPPWSTDWISAEGKEKLLALGIAPPNAKSTLTENEGKPKACPQCGSSHTELISRYSSTPCKAAYRCQDCLEPFEYFKCF